MFLLQSLTLVCVIVSTLGHDPCQICDKQSCSDDAVYGCFKEQKNRKLTGYKYATLYGKELVDCLTHCKDNAECKSVNYECSMKNCHLNNGQESDNPDNLIENDDYTYFERKACSDDLGSDFACYETVPDSTGVSPYYSQTVGSDTECTNLCLTYDSICRGVSFNTVTNECFLYDNVDTVFDVNSVYFTKLEVCKPNCYFKTYENRYLAGYNSKTVAGDSLHLCQELCAEENVEGSCNSVEFSSTLNQCYFSEEKKSVNPLKFFESSVYTYSEYECTDDVQDPDCFKRYQNTYLAGNTKEYQNSPSADTCRETCSGKSYCRSALYSKSRNTCYLNSDGVEGNKLRSNNDYEFFEKTC